MAQSTQKIFGKNRIQYKQFNWKYVSSTNFDVYFSDGGYDNAVLAAKYAELEYQRIIELLDYSPFNRVKIIVYNSYNDLLQSNIQPPVENPALGGQTNFVKSKIEVPFEGNQLEFKRNIAEQITKYLVTDMMYGGSIRNTYRNSIFLVLPEWYINGLAAYVARGWSNEMDDYLRDLFSHFKIRNPSAISMADQTLIGQSVWHYIAESQGKKSIANVLTLTRISRNYEIGISSNVGMRYSKFEIGWRDYYRHNADATIESYTLIDATKAVKKNRQLLSYYQVKSSPDGKLVAYSESNQGKYKVYVREVKTGKTRHFLTGGNKSIDQKLNVKTPLLAWKSDRVLSVIETHKSKIRMTTREISGGYTSRKVFGTFDQVIDFDYSDDGNSIIFSAEKAGKSDLFLFSPKSNTIKQLTNDLFDETHPVFLKGASNAFVFSSNRNTDTLTIPAIKLSAIHDNTNLFVYNPLVSTTLVKQLTKTSCHEEAPSAISANEIAYLQDETGIFNLSVLDINTGISKQLTNFQQNITSFDLSYTKNFSCTMQYKSRELLMVDYPINFLEAVKKPAKTPRKESVNFIENIFNDFNADSITQKLPKDTLQNLEDTVPVIESPTDNEPNNAKSHVDEQEITFGSDEVPLKQTKIPMDSTKSNANLKEDEIDVNNYTFESERAPLNNGDDDRNQFGTGITTKYRSEEAIKVSDYKPLRPMLNISNTITSLMFDPLRGFGVVGEVGLTDMLENHRLNAFVFGKFDLRTSNMIFEYEYLKKRIDYKFKYEKQRLYLSDSNNITQKSGLDKLEMSLIYPLSTTAKLSFTPFGLTANMTTISPPGYHDDKRNYFLGGRVELVYDNTITTGMNMTEGTRIRLTSDNYMGTKEKNTSFSSIEADIRNYKKVHREIIFATRLSTGTFYGKGAPNYLLGGLDNWAFAPDPVILNKESPLYFGPNVDSRQFLFNRYVTNLRGFNYSQQSGKSHLLFNAELRIPIVKYIYKGLINSEFLRNFQLVCFYDIGSAWTGTNPFNSENSFNTVTIDKGNTFKAKIINFKNPFLSSFGPGIHTHAMGYYIKFDVAWPMQDYEYKKPRFMVSLGYDF